MEDVSVVALLGRLVVSLAVVLALMALVGKGMQKRGHGSARGRSPAARIEVLARQSLGRHSSVAVVRVAGKTLVLGVADTHVSVLAEADSLSIEAEQALAPAEPERPTPLNWSSFVESLKDRTARRT